MGNALSSAMCTMESTVKRLSFFVKKEQLSSIYKYDVVLAT
jgi:hypothetical protein